MCVWLHARSCKIRARDCNEVLGGNIQKLIKPSLWPLEQGPMIWSFVFEVWLIILLLFSYNWECCYSFKNTVLRNKKNPLLYYNPKNILNEGKKLHMQDAEKTDTSLTVGSLIIKFSKYNKSLHKSREDSRFFCLFVLCLFVFLQSNSPWRNPGLLFTFKQQQKSIVCLRAYINTLPKPAPQLE